MSMENKIMELARKYEQYVIDQRRWVHQHAELAWQEHETTAHIEEELRKMGLEPQKFDGLTGCWAMIRGGKADENSKTILLRADIDAIETVENTSHDFPSLNKGVMHACGHDSHVGMLLGAAKVLTEIQDELEGNVKLFFQGAEEIAIGAKYYVEQGVCDGTDATLALHIASWNTNCTYSIPDGPQTASSDQFTVTIQGMACHGGMPHQGHDAITCMAATIMNLQPLVSRENDCRNASVITIGKVDAGFQYNVVAGKAILHGNVRDFDPVHRMEVAKRIEEVCKYTALAYGCTAEVDYEFKTGPVVHTNIEFNNLVREAGRKHFGEAAFKPCGPLTGSDDVAYLIEKVPGVFAFIGAYNEEKGCKYPHHHECFDVDEDAFIMGTVLLAQSSYDFCKK